MRNGKSRTWQEDPSVYLVMTGMQTCVLFLVSDYLAVPTVWLVPFVGLVYCFVALCVSFRMLPLLWTLKRRQLLEITISGTLLLLQSYSQMAGLRRVGVLRTILMWNFDVAVENGINITFLKGFWSKARVLGLSLLCMTYLWLFFLEPTSSDGRASGLLLLTLSGVARTYQRNYARRHNREYSPRRFEYLSLLSSAMLAVLLTLLCVVYNRPFPYQNFGWLVLFVAPFVAIFQVISRAWAVSLPEPKLGRFTIFRPWFPITLVLAQLLSLMRKDKELTMAIFICSITSLCGSELCARSKKPDRKRAVKRINFKYGSLIHRFFLHIEKNQSSRRIFYFLCINFIFMFVEFLYGFLTNSLGLISDACHMLFDCIALAIGLVASYIGSRESNSKFTYGYGRVKVVSGFTNGIFLLFIGVSVSVESVERLIHPPTIERGERLILVSFLGLLVNLVGVFFFHDAHSHAHSISGEVPGHEQPHHSQSHHGKKCSEPKAHSHGHGHPPTHRSKSDHSSSHEHSTDSHHHPGPTTTAPSHGLHHSVGLHKRTGHELRPEMKFQDHGHAHYSSEHMTHAECVETPSPVIHHGHSHHGHSHSDHNIRGVFLHILADTLGSVGVIISSLLVHYFGLTWSDAVCSMFISVLIFITVVPLLKETAFILLQRTPPWLAEWSKSVGAPGLLAIKGVRGVRYIKLWAFDGEQMVGTISLLIAPDSDRSHVMQEVRKLYGPKVKKSLTISLSSREDTASPFMVF